MLRILLMIAALGLTAAQAHEFDMRKLKQCNTAWDGEIASGRLMLFTDSAQAKQAKETYVEACMEPFNRCHAALKDDIATGRLTAFPATEKAEDGRVAYVEVCLKK